MTYRKEKKAEFTITGKIKSTEVNYLRKKLLFTISWQIVMIAMKRGILELFSYYYQP